MSGSLVHVCLRLEPEERRALAAFLASRGLQARFLETVDELVTCLPECVFLLLGRPPRIDFGPATKLELLQIAGAGVDPLFPATGLRAAAVVANCRGVHADSVRDHVLAAMFAFARNLPRALAQQSRREFRPFPSEPLSGKRLVLLGYGAIGQRVARAATALGLRVSAVCRTLREAPELEGLFTTEQLGDAVVDADFFVIAVPLTKKTRSLVDARVLAALPRRAVVIDVARGGVLDEAALEAALRQGRLAGAALDVFEREPLPTTSTLWDCPNLLITPHVAGYERGYLAKVFEVFAENVRRVSAGLPPLSPVSRSEEY